MLQTKKSKIFEKESMYFGDVKIIEDEAKSELRHGFGIEHFKNGDRYAGE